MQETLETWVQSLGQEDPLEEGIALLSLKSLVVGAQEEKEMTDNRGSLKRRAKAFIHSLVPAFVPRISWVPGVKQGSGIIMHETVSTVS